jgi:hypothetical protein
MEDDRGRAALAIRAVRVTYLDAHRTLERTAPDLIEGARRRALALLENVPLEIDGQTDGELSRLLDEARQAIEEA